MYINTYVIYINPELYSDLFYFMIMYIYIHTYTHIHIHINTLN